MSDGIPPQAESYLPEDAAAYTAIGRLLLVGLLASIAVMIAGLITAAARGSSAAHVLTLDRVLPQLFRGDPSAILDSGILLLFATPLFGVVAAFIFFLLQRNLAFSGVTGALLILLLIAFAVALH